MRMFVASCDCTFRGTYPSRAKANYALRIHRCERWIWNTYKPNLVAAARPDRTPKPCRHKQTTHQHGTHACYVLDACRCYPCAAANLVYEEERRHRHATRAFAMKWAPAAPVRKYVRTVLMPSGVGPKMIAQITGVPHGAISKLIYGNYKPGKRRRRPKRILRRNAEAILAVQPGARGSRAAAPEHRQLGARRAAQSLCWMGWSVAQQSIEVAVDRQALDRLMRGGVVGNRTVDQVLNNWGRLAVTPPPQNTPAQKAAVARTRRVARERKWASPMAWDEDTILDPKATPNRGKEMPLKERPVDHSAVVRRMLGDMSVRLTPQEKVEVVARLAAQGVSLAEIERRTGINPHRRAA